MVKRSREALGWLTASRLAAPNGIIRDKEAEVKVVNMSASPNYED
jgi:hypothetical protein